MANSKSTFYLICSLSIILLVVAISAGAYIFDNNAKTEAVEQQTVDHEQKDDAITRSNKSSDAILNLTPIGEREHHIDINDFYYQYPELPSGCEIVALDNQLKYYGFNPSKTEIYDNYMPHDSQNFRDAYVGDPYNEVDGATILPPGLRLTANKYLAANNSDYKAYDISNKNFEDLFAYIERGHPVQIWATMYMDVPGQITGSYDKNNFFTNEHSLLLTGFNKDEDMVDVCCSLEGNVQYSLEQTKEIWNQIGKYAVVIVKNSEGEAWAGYDQSN